MKDSGSPGCSAAGRRTVVALPVKEDVLAHLEAGGLVEPSWEELGETTRQLQQTQGLFADVLESMSDVVVVTDNRGRIRTVNRALCERTGYAAPELLGQPLSLVFGEAHGRSVQIHACARAGDCPEQLRKALHACEVYLLTREGRPGEPVTLSCQPHRTPTLAQGEDLARGLVIIGRPVGELRRAYEALAQAQEERLLAQQRLLQAETMASLGRLVAGVAHELNNPVSFVYGNACALARYQERLQAYLQAEQPAEGMAAALRQRLRIDALAADLPSLVAGTVEGATRIRDLVQDLLTLSAPIRGPAEGVELATLVAEAILWVRRNPRWPAGLSVTNAVPAGLEVLAHPGRLQQVMVNLLANAGDALAEISAPTPAGRNLAPVVVRAEVRCDAEGRRWVVAQVEDRGPGFDPGQTTALFEPFYTTKPVGKGTGLGLWISYTIAGSYGGRLEAANAPEGGAVFTLILPLHAEPGRAEPAGL